jgi:predicted PurR-regulated permease PerM
VTGRVDGSVPPAPAEPTETQRPGPADAHTPEFWNELRRALIWTGVVGATAIIVILIQPILYILGAIVIAIMLDGGTRLLGRVLPIGRSWRLALLILAIIAFVAWTVWLTGTQVSQQAAQLPALVETQIARLSIWLSGHGVTIGFAELRQAGEQLMNSIGRVTAALSSAAGLLSSLVMMVVLAIFLATEPKLYSRGLAWFVPIDHREDTHALIDKVGWTLRRLMAGRLVGMMATGLLTGVLLTIAGVPMATLLGILTFMLAFLPNIGAIISGVLITLVGFSVDVQHGLLAIGVYFAVQTVESYFITPTVARRAVDMPPALVLGAQIMFGGLFGVLGLALADPMLAMLKVMLEERAKRRMAERGD